MKYDIVIPVAFKDYSFLKRTVRCVEKHLDAERIYIITRGSISGYLSRVIRKDVRCVIVDEDHVVDGLTFEHVRAVLSGHATCSPSTGWYYQQLLKYAFALSGLSQNRYYVTWDADTLPVRPIPFFTEDGKPLFTMKDEHHEPYYDTIYRLLGISDINTRSYISEQMVFDKEIVNELLEEIVRRGNGNFPWYDSIILSTDPIEPSAFSEFETYGNFCRERHRGYYVERTLPSFRKGGYIAGRFISDRKLHFIAFDQATVSFELGDYPPMPIGALHYLYARYKRLQQSLIMRMPQNTPPQ